MGKGLCPYITSSQIVFLENLNRKIKTHFPKSDKNHYNGHLKEWQFRLLYEMKNWRGGKIRALCRSCALWHAHIGPFPKKLELIPWPVSDLIIHTEFEKYEKKNILFLFFIIIYFLKMHSGPSTPVAHRRTKCSSQITFSGTMFNSFSAIFFTLFDSWIFCTNITIFTWFFTIKTF